MGSKTKPWKKPLRKSCNVRFLSRWRRRSRCIHNSWSESRLDYSVWSWFQHLSSIRNRALTEWPIMEKLVLMYTLSHMTEYKYILIFFFFNNRKDAWSTFAPFVQKSDPNYFHRGLSVFDSCSTVCSTCSRVASVLGPTLV